MLCPLFLCSLLLGATEICHAALEQPRFPDPEKLIELYNLAGCYKPSTHKMIKKQVSIETAKRTFPHVKLEDKASYGFVTIGKCEENYPPRVGGRYSDYSLQSSDGGSACLLAKQVR